MKKTILILVVVLVLALPGVASARAGWHAWVDIISGNDGARLLIGGHLDYTDGYDYGEMDSWLDGYLQAYFYHPEWNRTETSYYWSDLRDPSLPKEWTFYVAARYRSLTVSWDLKDTPDTIELQLVDTYDGTTIDMRAQSLYTYSNRSTSPRVFTVKATGTFEPVPEEKPGGEEPPPEVPQDTTPPETAITSELPEYSASTELTVAYEATDDTSPVEALEYSYSIDGGDWSEWGGDTSATLSGLVDGEHVFAVRSRDEAGNEDESAAVAAFSIDTTAPVLTLASPNPTILWPPTGKMTNVTFTGTASDTGSGLASATYSMTDEYALYGGSGSLAVSTSGTFTFVLSLEADREGDDENGRVYTVTVTVVDNVGNSSSSTTAVTVPHDNGNNGK